MDSIASWNLKLIAAVCEKCDWSFLLQEESLSQHCPHCFQVPLTILGEGIEQLTSTGAPEKVLPFTLSQPALEQSIQRFSKGTPFSPLDLNAQNLRSRLRRVFLPMWLVDADVSADWKAEVGFDYQVVSHQDRYDERGGGWSSHEVKEGRVRWEPRLGRLKRSYTNIPAPALEQHARYARDVGPFDLDAVHTYQPEAIEKAYIRLPDRSPEDSWTDAKPAIQAAASKECMQAASAGHIRQFTWQPEFKNQNWTLLLQPLYTTYYNDDNQHPLPVLVNAQTGQLSGVRRASMKRARRTALVILAIAIVLFVISLLIAAASIVFPIILAIGVLGLAVAFVLGASAVLPLVTVWWFNRK